jgi:hypothetical protein
MVPPLSTDADGDVQMATASGSDHELPRDPDVDVTAPVTEEGRGHCGSAAPPVDQQLVVARERRLTSSWHLLRLLQKQMRLSSIGSKA